MKEAANWIQELVEGTVPVIYVPSGEAFSYQMIGEKEDRA